MSWSASLPGDGTPLADVRGMQATGARTKEVVEARKQGERIERERIRQLALTCASDIDGRAPSPEFTDRGAKVLRDFAALLEAK